MLNGNAAPVEPPTTLETSTINFRKLESRRQYYGQGCAKEPARILRLRGVSLVSRRTGDAIKVFSDGAGDRDCGGTRPWSGGWARGHAQRRPRRGGRVARPP